MTWLRRWWVARPLPLRVAAAVAAVALVSVLLLARGSAAVVEWTLAEAVDTRLEAAVAATAPQVAAGRGRPLTPQPGGDVTVRVLDRAGTPRDGGPRPQLSREGLRRLLAGQPAESSGGDGEDPTRWSGRVVTIPDGSQRLVTAAADLVGYRAIVHRSVVLLSLAGALAAVAVGTAGWAAASAALRPVARMRAAAAGLPPGQRLPVPAARDEVRELAEALNELLARRDTAAERVRRFTGDAAHELRSPVAAIRAQAEVASMHPDPELATDVAAEAQRLSALLDDLLALARADAGERLPAEPVDLAEAARQAVARLDSETCWQGRGIDGVVRLAVRVVAPSAAVVQAAPSDAARVLDNLLGNAVRHARHSVRLAVLAGSGAVRVIVDDDGDGVAPEHRDAVFNRFHRVQPERDRASGGTGLGLALVAETVRRYGGVVRVGDAPAGGARFEVRWPSAP
ncbi:MAG: HAMP domain-containing protein [Pseudonocardiaceae bacterium]|nr:HAMP domain-containing protein [Pseudonocardiaceae bacterium]